jgi:membrane associated rhomboid family serine protease
VTFGIMAICIAVTALVEPSLAFSSFGLVPQNPSLAGFFGHIFIHAGWGHLAGNLVLLLLAGPPIEDRWGRPLFATFYMSCGLFAGAFFMTTAPDSPLPLVGASGAIAGVLGACMIRHWKSKIRFFYFFFFIKGTFHAPVWAMLPLWFGSEILAARMVGDVGSTGGIAYWAHVGGFMWGAAITAAIARWKVEERFVQSAIEDKITVLSNPLLEKALEVHSSGDLPGAYKLLTQAAKESPNNPDTISALWEMACALGRPKEAVRAMYRIANTALREGDKKLAAQFWGDVIERVPKARAEPTWLVRLAPALLELDQRQQAAVALRHAVSKEQSTVSLGTVLRVLDLARGIDPHAGVHAARRALKSPDLQDSRREGIQQQLADFEVEAANQPAHFNWETGVDRSIAIDDDELLTTTPSPSSGYDKNAPDPFSSEIELDATGQLVSTPCSAGDKTPMPLADLLPEEVMQLSLERFMGVKVTSVKPIELLDHSISVMTSEGKATKLEYERISAIAAAAIPGKSSKPVLIVDLVLNWNDSNAEILHTVRLHSDTFDVRRLIPIARRPMDAFRALIAELLSRSSAVPLPDETGARGHPFRSYPDLETYQCEALSIKR